MKIGIMGGTFDPIHNGHLMLGRFAYQEFKLDEIWYMPNGNPPHKQNQSKSAIDHRVAMVRIGIQAYPFFKLCLHEVMKSELSYSYQTMEELKRDYPNDEFYFILGADSLLAIESWKHPERFLDVCTILAACRDQVDREAVSRQIDCLNKKYHANIRLLRTPQLDISSRDIRCRVAQGEPLSQMVPQEIENYIHEHHLFEGKEL